MISSTLSVRNIRTGHGLTALVCGVLLGGVVLFGGCTPVPPYQRGHLTSPAMDAAQESHEARFRAHVLDAREGATGGHGSTGGGCGCN